MRTCLFFIVVALVSAKLEGQEKGRFGYQCTAPIYKVNDYRFITVDHSVFYQKQPVTFFAGYSMFFFTPSNYKGGINVGASIALKQANWGNINLCFFDDLYSTPRADSRSRLNIIHANFNYELLALKNFLAFQVGPSLSFISDVYTNEKDPKRDYSRQYMVISLMLRLTITLSSGRSN